ncbi:MULTISPECIES: precorrin-3B synthase [unclassified Methylobacterium]|uniref:precorrin-3B synthase n=1 Tax=unclassified Methylobacterium TaxID=2615210 RepID=UPI00089ECE49|nr:MULTISPECIES: precorrin-3B synthase [unclassified Methylobacterium]MBN4096599.1 precorrin-3B synthase [Methylobacterium sp. OT2]SEG42696.1 precorrin-3B synthase [Methylobacterium sp. 190mf]
MSATPHRRVLPEAPARRGWCPGLARPMPTGDGLLARVHPPLGILTLDQARAVAEGARLFGNGHLDLTARANLQIRGVSEATRAPLAAWLAARGLGDVRADGGPQRLTLTSPLAGHDPDETIDVPVLARAIETAGLAIPGLPAKTLVVVEGRAGRALPEADLSVVAEGPGRVALTVAYGETQRTLLTCAEDAAPGHVATLLGSFARTGRRRMRDLSDGELTALTELLPAETPIDEPAQAHRGFAPEREPARPAGGRGLRSVAVDAPFGRCTADALDRIAAAAAALGANEIRLSPTRGFVMLVPISSSAAAATAALAVEFIVVPDDPRRAIAACTGAPGCASGSTPTLADAARLAAAFGTLAAAGHTAHVSGCAKGCARPGPADLTLVGRDGLYGVVIGGAPGDEPAMDLPIEAVLERLGRAETDGLSAAFAPETAPSECGRTRRPA